MPNFPWDLAGNRVPKQTLNDSKSYTLVEAAHISAFTKAPFDSAMISQRRLISFFPLALF